MWTTEKSFRLSLFGDFALFLKKDSIPIELEGEKLIIVSQNAILLLIRDEDLLS